MRADYKNPAAREKLVLEIQKGNKELRESFLMEHQRFVAATVSVVLGGRSINREADDEFSIGLIALNEALDSYDPKAGASFLYFAKQVISRRIIDNLRRVERNSRTIALSSLEEKGGHSALSIPSGTEKIEVKEDFQAFAAQLKEFSISMTDLVRSSPRHKDSKQLAISIGKTLAEDPELIAHLIKKKTMPLKKLLLKVNVNPKTVERHRIYIIAVALILSSNLETLKGYIYATDGGGGRK